MSYGFWGGRFPACNVFWSSLVYLAFFCRRQQRILTNRYLRRLPSTNSGQSGVRQREEIENFIKQGLERINIGGGNKILQGFINMDFVSFPHIPNSMVADIRDLSFIPSNSMRHLHSNHVIEHLPQAHLPLHFSQCNRILKKGGLLTIRCPNALGAAYGFWFKPVIESQPDEFRKLGFPEDESLANPADNWMYRDLFALYHWFYGDTDNKANEHLAIITPSKLRKLLSDAGFEILKISEPEAVNLVVVANKV